MATRSVVVSGLIMILRMPLGSDSESEVQLTSKLSRFPDPTPRLTVT